jgi:hypothetical protein
LHLFDGLSESSLDTRSDQAQGGFDGLISGFHDLDFIGAEGTVRANQFVKLGDRIVRVGDAHIDQGSVAIFA